MSYINKAYRSYEKLSRYEPFPYYFDTEAQRYSYGITNYLDSTTPASSYATKQGDTLDAIALYWYGNPTYYWIIADFNRILDCFAVLPTNTLLKIPSISSIEFKV